MNYPMYNNSQYYMQNLQDMRDRIDNQIRNYQQSQMQQQPMAQPITQNFQLAPTPSNTNNELESKYANNIEDVKNTFVMKTGIFVNKEMNTLWLKNINGDIRTFTLNEIVEEDPKDIEIRRLKNELNEIKGMINNANEPVNTIIDEPITSEKQTRVSNSKRTNAK